MVIFHRPSREDQSQDLHRPKLAYEKPTVQFWAASELNAIQATMSGGGGYVGGGGGSGSSSGNGGSYSATGSGSQYQAKTYQGRADYRFRDIFQRGVVGYRYSTAGWDDVVGYTYYTVDIVGACAAVLDSATSGVGASILDEATLTVHVTGDSRSKLLHSNEPEAFSNPATSEYGSSLASGVNDALGLLAVCVGIVNTELGAFMSIVSFIGGKLLGFGNDRSLAELFSYGYTRQCQFAQGIRLTLRVPAEHTSTTVRVQYFVPGESSETEHIDISKSFTVYGK